MIMPESHRLGERVRARQLKVGIGEGLKDHRESQDQEQHLFDLEPFSGEANRDQKGDEYDEYTDRTSGFK